jgi:predicted membrane-bound dolichyl-phosphate-mannose-protein mannosyltransferase
MFKRINIFPICVLIVIMMLSCKTSDKISELSKENQLLKEEIIELNHQINKIGYLPILLPKESSVKLGDIYEAAFFTGVFNTDNPPMIIVSNPNDSNFADSIVYDEEQRCSIFRYKPTNKGLYSFSADMKIFTIKDTILFPIRWSFDVK